MSAVARRPRCFFIDPATDADEWLRDNAASLVEGDVLIDRRSVRRSRIWGFESDWRKANKLAIQSNATCKHKNACAHYADVIATLRQNKVRFDFVVSARDEGIAAYCDRTHPSWQWLKLRWRGPGDGTVFATLFGQETALPVLSATLEADGRVPSKLLVARTAALLVSAHTVMVVSHLEIASTISAACGATKAYFTTYDTAYEVTPGVRLDDPAAGVGGRGCFTVYCGTQKQIDKLVSLVTAEYKHVRFHRLPPDRGLMRNHETNTFRIEWISKAPLRLPYQSLVFIETAMVLDMLPVYELLEVVEWLPWAGRWTRFKLVELIERVRRSVQRVRDARAAAAESKRSNRTTE